MNKQRQVPESFQPAPERALIIREVWRDYGVSEEELLTAKRGKKNEPRTAAIYLCRQMRNDTLKDLGEAFGMTGYSPAGSAMDRIKKKLPSDRRLQKRLKQITIAVFNQNKCQSETKNSASKTKPAKIKKILTNRRVVKDFRRAFRDGLVKIKRFA